MRVPQRDIEFGKIVRWLAAHGLEMHTSLKGETWICKRRAKRARVIEVKEDEG